MKLTDYLNNIREFIAPEGLFRLNFYSLAYFEEANPFQKLLGNT